tara:strand:+ start:2367 stop:3086 length:720 start_codon:yes stop_codon:yes gene_type:complete
MTKIPTQLDPTIEAMYKAIEAKQSREKRDYLGASLIGNPCPRQIWYQYNGFPQKPFKAETLMNFDDGHRTEDLTAERLRMVDGIELRTHMDDGSQFGFTALDGKFKGHADGFIRGLKQSPKAWHVWEAKCSGEKKWKEFKSLKAKHGEKNTLKHWNENYYAQAQLYMHYSQMDRHYLTVAYAGGRMYDSCRTEYNGAIAERYIDRADKIIKTNQPPEKISDKADFYICRWCDFREACHG